MVVSIISFTRWEVGGGGWDRMRGGEFDFRGSRKIETIKKQQRCYNATSVTSRDSVYARFSISSPPKQFVPTKQSQL